MNNIILVGIGGFIGAVSRYLSVLFVNRISGVNQFPLGTFSVNMIGCFLLGFGAGLALQKNIISAEIRLLFFTGFLGSFTTYSTFGVETVDLFKTSGFSGASLNIILHIIIGLSAVWAGDFLSRVL